MLDPGPNDRPLRCDVTPQKPLLNYSFRFQAGYVVSVPMNQYQGSGHTLTTMVRITPDGSSQPVGSAALLTLTLTLVFISIP